jgi:hypothetical protein
MSSDAVIDCAGHPRDMGEAQGQACADEVRSWLRAQGLPVERSRRFSLRAYTSGPVLGAGVGREIVRHFTHLSERIDGLARRARVPAGSIAGMHVRAVGRNAFGSTDGQALALGLRRGSGDAEAQLVCSLPALSRRDQAWCIRRSRPAVGFASVEVTLPWLVSSMAGVNSAGLAVGFVAGSDARPVGAEAECAAPTILLVQECLQRFEGLEAGIDWCLDRPVIGDGVIVLADARGEMASVHVEQGDRRVSWPIDGMLLRGGGAEVESLLQKREEVDALLANEPLPDGTLRSALGHDAQRVLLSPAERSLRVIGASGAGQPVTIEG